MATPSDLPEVPPFAVGEGDRHPRAGEKGFATDVPGAPVVLIGTSAGSEMDHRILIVDDEPNIVLSLEFLMKREGFEVSIADDGVAALQAMEAATPDLVILDVMMPRLDGFAVCRRIRADARWRGVKVLMLSARGRETEVAKGLGLGADAYVTKPFATRELVATVRGLLERAG